MAPYYNQIYRFGDYLVEQVQGKPQNWGSPSQDLATFRVKKAGGDMENAPVLAKFEVGQVYRVLKHNDSSLVLFRQIQNPRNDPTAACTYPPTTEALVVDMRNPASPAPGGQGQGAHDERRATTPTGAAWAPTTAASGSARRTTSPPPSAGWRSTPASTITTGPTRRASSTTG